MCLDWFRPPILAHLLGIFAKALRYAASKTLRANELALPCSMIQLIGTYYSISFILRERLQTNDPERLFFYTLGSRYVTFMQTVMQSIPQGDRISTRG